MATLPYGAGSFGSGNLPYGVGSSGSPYEESADLSQLQELMDSSLLTPEEFTELSDKLRSPYGNYRSYASAWQMKRKGKSQAQDAYAAAMSGEDVIPSAERSTSGTSRMSSRRASDTSAKSVAKPKVHVGLSGERTRIPETSMGRDLSGELKFRIPEEETAYEQSELQRKYDEAMFVPRLKEKAVLEKTSQIESERKLATSERRLKEETRTADRDVDATIERLLKSKDTNDVAEGRRLKREMDSLTETEKKRDFTRERDDKKFDRKIEELRIKQKDKKELLTERNEMNIAMQGIRQEDRVAYLDRQIAERRTEMNRDVDEESINKTYASAYDIAKSKRDLVVKMSNIEARKAISIADDAAYDAAVATATAADAEFAKTVTDLDKQRSDQLEATKTAEEPATGGPIPGVYEIVVNGRTVQTKATTVEQAMKLVAKGAKFVSQY